MGNGASRNRKKHVLAVMGVIMTVFATMGMGDGAIALASMDRLMSMGVGMSALAAVSAIALATMVMVMPRILFAAAMIALAQLVNVIGTHTCFGNLIDDISLAVVAVAAVHVRRIQSGTEYGLAQGRMNTRILTQGTHCHVDQKARDERRQHLDNQNGRHALQGHMLGHKHGQHLV